MDTRFSSAEPRLVRPPQTCYTVLSALQGGLMGPRTTCSLAVGHYHPCFSNEGPGALDSGLPRVVAGLDLHLFEQSRTLLLSLSFVCKHLKGSSRLGSVSIFQTYPQPGGCFRAKALPSSLRKSEKMICRWPWSRSRTKPRPELRIPIPNMSSSHRD